MALVIPVTTQEKINTMARKLHSAGIPGGIEQLMSLILTKALHFQAVSIDPQLPAPYDFTLMPDGTTSFGWCVNKAGNSEAVMVGGLVLDADSRWFRQWMDNEIQLHQLPEDAYDSGHRGPRWGSHT